MAETTGSKHILVCDDDRDIVDFLYHLLSASGYSVSMAFNHKDCMELFHQRRPDLILLDVRMPEHNGFWVAENLIEAGNRAPVIFLTAHDVPLYRLCAPIAGAVSFISKPFDPALLIETIHKALKHDPKDSNWFLQAIAFEKARLQNSVPNP